MVPNIFRVRSRERTAQDNASRRRAVVGVLERQREACAREIEGLRARMEQYYAQASFALDSAGELGTRDPEDEKRIADLETSGHQAREQLRELTDELALYDRLLAEVARG